MKKQAKKLTAKKAKAAPMVVSIVLDETGSMQGRKRETITAFNEYVASLKKIKAPVNVSLTKFNSTKVNIVYSNTPLKDVPVLDEKTYAPDNLTPLYDAVGTTVRALEAEKIKGKSVLIAIITDGEENASKEWNQHSIFDLIKAKQKEGWTFVFMGADQDAWAAGAKIGLVKANTMSFAGNDIKGAMRTAGAATMQFAMSSNRSAGTSSVNFFNSTSTKRKGMTK